MINRRQCNLLKAKLNALLRTISFNFPNVVIDRDRGRKISLILNVKKKP